MSFFRSFTRNLENIYARSEEVQEMMPISPTFQRQGYKLHMRLSYDNEKLKQLLKAAVAPKQPEWDF